MAKLHLPYSCDKCPTRLGLSLAGAGTCSRCRCTRLQIRLYLRPLQNVPTQKRPLDTLPAVGSCLQLEVGRASLHRFLTSGALSAAVVAQPRFLPGPVRPFHRRPDLGELHTRSRTCFVQRGNAHIRRSARWTSKGRRRTAKEALILLANLGAIDSTYQR